MRVTKVLVNENTQIDISDKTAEVNSVKTGITAHTSSGNQIVGDCELGEVEKVWCNTTSTNVINIKNGTNNSGTLTFNPTALNWNYKAVESGLTFQWREVKSLRARFSCDYVITGLVSGGSLGIAIASYTGSGITADTGRIRYDGFYPSIGDGQTGDMSGHYESNPKIITLPWKDAGSTGSYDDSYYIGWQIFAYTGAGSHVEVSNIKFEIEMPSIEDAIITRHISGEYENDEVTWVGGGRFRQCQCLESVNFPDVSGVNAYAFYSCHSLSSVSLPAYTQSVIPEGAFGYCSSLTSVGFSQVTTIYSYAFRDCTKLTQVSFPSVTYLSSQAFYNCTKLSDTYFPNLTDCGSSAFQSTAIDKVDNDSNFPNLSHTGTNGFQGTPVSYVSVPKFNSINNNTFNGCKSLASVHAPNVGIIWGTGFANCTALHDIYLPKLSSLGGSAFQNAGLQRITLYGYLSSNSTTNFAGNKSLSVAVARVYTNLTGGNMFSGCTALTAYDGFGRIAGNDFKDCTNLSTIVLRNLTTATLASTTAFTNTPFASGKTGGTIYIPSDHYQALGTGTSLDYKSATNWSIMDGWGTITWANIYGSPYESKYADGTDFPWIAYVNSDGTPLDNIWDYEWDYTDGLLSSNGWSKYSSGSSATESLVSDGVKLVSNSSQEIRMYKEDWNTHKKALMEVTMYFSGLNANQRNNRISLGNSDGYTVTFFPCNAYWRPQNNTTINSCLITTDAVANTSYTLRLLLIDGCGFVWVNNSLKAYPVSPGTATQKFSYPLVSSCLQNNQYGIFQSIKLKAWDD